MVHALSVDVEDWNNVAVLAKHGKVMPPTEAVVRNTHRMLELFQAHGANATWFILGEVAETFPDLVRQLASAGQEIGVHGYHHHNVFDLNENQFRDSIRRAKDAIEQIAGQPVQGYRATSFSIRREQWWAFDVLCELGFRYDSSVFPIRGRRYGIPDAPLQAYTHETVHGPLREIPLSVVELGRFRLPCCGGGYLRHFPLWYTKIAMHQLVKKGRPAVFYLHPYEVDSTFDDAFFEQTLGSHSAAALGRWRYMQYRNREKTISKLRWLLERHTFEAISRVFDAGASYG